MWFSSFTYLGKHIVGNQTIETKTILQKNLLSDFLDGPVIEPLSSNAVGAGLICGLGTKIRHASKSWPKVNKQIKGGYKAKSRVKYMKWE